MISRTFATASPGIEVARSTISLAADGTCDDGGPGSQFALCQLHGCGVIFYPFWGSFSI